MTKHGLRSGFRICTLRVVSHNEKGLLGVAVNYLHRIYAPLNFLNDSWTFHYDYEILDL